MEILFSPWRMKYLKKGQESYCIFCKAWEEKEGLKTLCFLKGKETLIMLNMFPYTNGHLMVVPFKHTSNLEELSKENLIEIMEFIILSKKIIDKNFKPNGYNIGFNIGKCAGAGFKDHLHVHIVPRWEGDTNFMTTISNVRLIPQKLEETYKLFKKSVKEIL